MAWYGKKPKCYTIGFGATVRRPSVVIVREAHPEAVQAMEERFPEAGVHNLIRFLQARDFDVTTLATRKFYLLDDTDAVGHPVLFYCLQRFKEAPYNVDDEIKALVYLLENEVKPKMGDSFETQKWSVLIDVSNVRSPPLNFLQQVNNVMEANYPERLFRTIMFPVPVWLQRIIQSCLAFVDENTRNKFAYVNDLKSLEEFAMMPKEKMEPDIVELAKNKKL